MMLPVNVAGGHVAAVPMRAQAAGEAKTEPHDSDRRYHQKAPPPEALVIRPKRHPTKLHPTDALRNPSEGVLVSRT